MKEIHRLSQLYGFRIIEDASHAVGGSYCFKPVGSCCYSDITVFSFHPVKIITTGEGGALTTNNEEIYKNALLLRSHGITKDESTFEYVSPGSWYYEQQLLGFNYRLPDINAALGLSQLTRLSSNLLQRNRILEIYKSCLASLPLSFLDIPADVQSSLHLAVLRLSFHKTDFHRQLFNTLRIHKIGVQLHYYPVHLQPYYRRLGFKVGDFPMAELYAQTSMSLPIFPELSMSQVQRVCDVIIQQF